MVNAALSRIMTATVIVVLAGPVLDSQTPRPNPCTGPEYRQFDFWLGEWTVTGADGKPAGTNRIERIAGGCGLQETWTSATGGDGRSLNAYTPQDGKWHQVWLGSGGLWLELSGGLRDGRMVMEGQTRGSDKSPVLQRITWMLLEDGRVRQVWEMSKDGGKSWSVAFNGMYAKR